MAYSKCFWSLLCFLLFITHKNNLWILLSVTFLLLLLLSYKRKRKRQLCAQTEWKWHSDRNNNNTLTEQPALGGWKLSSTHNIQQQWQSTKTRTQFEQQWLQQQQQNLWTERWQMIASMNSWRPEFSRNPQKGKQSALVKTCNDFSHNMARTIITLPQQNTWL